MTLDKKPNDHVALYYSLMKLVVMGFFYLAILLLSRLTVFRKFHERKPLHWPNFSQLEYRWRTGGSKSFSCPCNNVRNLYYSHTHCSDFCFPLQEMGTCESNFKCWGFFVYSNFVYCIGAGELECSLCPVYGVFQTQF